MSAQHKGPRHKVPALFKVADGGNIDGKPWRQVPPEIQAVGG